MHCLHRNRLGLGRAVCSAPAPARPGEVKESLRNGAGARWWGCGDRGSPGHPGSRRTCRRAIPDRNTGRDAAIGDFPAIPDRGAPVAGLSRIAARMGPGAAVTYASLLARRRSLGSSTVCPSRGSDTLSAIADVVANHNP